MRYGCAYALGLETVLNLFLGPVFNLADPLSCDAQFIPKSSERDGVASREGPRAKDPKLAVVGAEESFPGILHCAGEPEQLIEPQRCQRIPRVAYGFAALSNVDCLAHISCACAIRL